MIEEAGGVVDYDLPPPEVGKETGKLTRADRLVRDRRADPVARSLPEQVGREHRGRRPSSRRSVARRSRRPGSTASARCRSAGCWPTSATTWAPRRRPDRGRRIAPRMRRIARAPQAARPAGRRPTRPSRKPPKTDEAAAPAPEEPKAERARRSKRRRSVRVIVRAELEVPRSRRLRGTSSSSRRPRVSDCVHRSSIGLTRAVGRPDVAAAGPHQAVVVELLDEVGRPAGHPGHGEDRRVEVDVQPQVVIEPGARPVDVGRQLLLGGHGLLDRLGDPLPAVVADFSAPARGSTA